MIAQPGSRHASGRAGCTVGLDLGGTKIFGVALDATTQRVLDRRKVANPRGSAAELVAAFEQLIEALTPPTQPLIGVGLGLAGLVDLDGVLRYGPNVPGVVDFEVRESLESRFDVPVTIDNDASMALRAELSIGAGAGFDEVLLITQGTGIGGAFATSGRIVRGANGFAGEPGHMLVQRDGHRCACGRFGCWEAYASGAGLVNLWSDLFEEGRGRGVLARAGDDVSAVRGEHISAAADDGHSDAVEVFSRFSTWVAQGLASLVTLLDPEIIVLGGGLAVANRHFLADVQDQTAAAVLGDHHRPEVRVVSAQFGEAAGAIGSALAAVPGLSPDELSPT